MFSSRALAACAASATCLTGSARADEKLGAVRSSLRLSDARAIVDATLDCGRRARCLPLAVMVLDSGGAPVCFAREDGCGLLRHDIARAKAWTCLAMGMSSRALRDRFATRSAFLGALSDVSAGRLAPAPGGVLIVDADGEVVGAVGVSGDASDKDEACAIDAVRRAGFASDPLRPAENWEHSDLSGSTPSSGR